MKLVLKATLPFAVAALCYLKMTYSALCLLKFNANVLLTVGHLFQCHPGIFQLLFLRVQLCLKTFAELARTLQLGSFTVRVFDLQLQLLLGLAKILTFSKGSVQFATICLQLLFQSMKFALAVFMHLLSLLLQQLKLNLQSAVVFGHAPTSLARFV
mmetsp:Transcript_25422/g.59046  ORF Transcript_25422/g.59046 Transcript_25422/m.59046 type:complete len:156 (+) Transcript_25422:2151-2618(+)